MSQQHKTTTYKRLLDIVRKLTTRDHWPHARQHNTERYV